MAGTLYLCATPIGNLEDMTFRAVRMLGEVDLIAAEDTRNSIKLLNHFEIKIPMTSYHEYNKIDKGHYLVRRLLEGEDIALITDAGTGYLRSGRGACENVSRSGCDRDGTSGSGCMYHRAYHFRTGNEKICI